jgi:hypothetical protein
MILVEGEEDLLVLPAVFFLPLGGVVLYGLPKKGLVICNVNEKYKQLVKSLLKKESM